MSGFEELRKFHTERRNAQITVTVEKSPLPMLWLDSSVLIDFAKIDNKEKVENVRAARLSKLRELVRKLVRAEKLICPEWDQSLEFEGKRLEDRIRRIVSDLSCGAHCVPYAGVKDQQIINGLTAYQAFATAVHIPAKIHFYGNPLSAIREAKQSGFIVEAVMSKPVEWVAKTDKDKRAILRAWEGLRQEYHGKKRTFEEQLALERIGESDAMLSMIGDYMKKVASGELDFWAYMGIQGFYTYQYVWRQMGGVGDPLAAVYSFMRSPYYWELPVQDISCRLCSDLLVRHFEVKPGDQQDINHLAAAIPVAHYVVADKSMVDRCERLDIGSKWKTKLFSTRTIENLCEELGGLP